MVRFLGTPAKAPKVKMQPMMPPAKMPKEMPPKAMPMMKAPAGKPAVTGKANALTRVPTKAPAYGLRGTKPPTGKKK